LTKDTFAINHKGQQSKMARYLATKRYAQID